MKIITTPHIEIVAQSTFNGSSTFLIPDDGDDHVKIGSFAAKVCYDSNGVSGRPNEDNQRAILEHRHGSVLEHMTVSLYITGITRSLTLELNRHRTNAISQRSTRYTAEEDSSIVLEPYYAALYEKYKEYILDPNLSDISDIRNFNINEFNFIAGHISDIMHQLSVYNKEVMWLMNINPGKLEGFELRKWARGKARNTLPHAIESRGVWSNNHRGWRWFIESRSDAHAEAEIRRLADKVLTVLRTTSPLYYEDFTIDDIVDDIPVWKPKYSKV